MYIGPCIAFFRVRVSRVRISKFSYRSADTDSKQKIWTALRGASPRAIAKILSLTADERQVSLLALINVPVPSPNRVNTQTARASRWHESTVWAVTLTSRQLKRAVSNFTSVHKRYVDGRCIHLRTQIRKKS